jgi:hypothetical protein
VEYCTVKVGHPGVARGRLGPKSQTVCRLRLVALTLQDVRRCYEPPVFPGA